jgi:hypothetical protein
VLTSIAGTMASTLPMAAVSWGDTRDDPFGRMFVD